MSISNIGYSNMVQTMQAAQAAKHKQKIATAQMMEGKTDERSDEQTAFTPADVAALPETMELETGEVLFHEGDPSGCAFFIETGNLEVTARQYGETKVLGVARKGEIVGELGVIVASPRSATVRATEYTKVRVVHAHVLEDMIATATPGVKALMNTLVDRLRRAAAGD
ncbi:cyclic nucleotide-binding domain-containing protein [Terasakiella sp. A23]|uniref:cyclic nucleotide-binding domain-containing protein n=1 Tax=Terasakiella sp. FCG-A23 TaxID=3080561 RepID=UPI0029540DDB|nr:cyclic nucleotide-binding domain-containing protein [Terasakiella sp. A23]MDV7339139.1 cyclic nucleotide-binding domain-containing protein [Terasakiella sp. A23]